jgi:hypothetical protein
MTTFRKLFALPVKRRINFDHRRYERIVAMKKCLIATVVFFLLGLMVVDDTFARGHGPGRGHAWRHGHVHSRVGIGFAFGPPFWGPWHYVPYYPPPPPTIIIERQTPPIYIEQPQVERRPQDTYAGYWYYCQSPSGYYPEVRECPAGWVKVPPRP